MLKSLNSTLRLYLFDGILTAQDGGVAFGGIYVPGIAQGRRTQVAHIIENAMSSWYSG